MSLLCTVEECIKGAEIECDCEGNSRFCGFHYQDHSEKKGCNSYREVSEQVKIDFKIAMITIKELDRKERELIKSSHNIINGMKKHLAKINSEIRNRKEKASKFLINGGVSFDIIQKMFSVVQINKDLTAFKKATKALIASKRKDKKPKERNQIIQM